MISFCKKNNKTFKNDSADSGNDTLSKMTKEFLLEPSGVSSSQCLSEINKNYLMPKSQSKIKSKSASLSKSKINSAKGRGDHAESIVCEYFLKKGYQLIAHRKKIFGVEFDLIMKNENDLVYIEVKSVHSPDFYLLRWPKRQRLRFERVAAVLSEKQRSHFYLAMVDYNDKVHLFRVGTL